MSEQRNILWLPHPGLRPPLCLCEGEGPGTTTDVHTMLIDHAMLEVG